MTFWAFFWHAVGVFGGVAMGYFLGALFTTAGRADFRDSLTLAYSVGDAMCAALRGQLARKDLKRETRIRFCELVNRWGALRPATTTNAPPLTDAACVACSENPDNYPVSVPTVWVPGMKPQDCVGAEVV